MMPVTTRPRPARRPRPVVAWSVLSTACAAACAIVAVPAVLLRPFSPQTPAMIAWSFQLRRLAPILTALLLVLAAAAAFRVWRRSRRPGRAAAMVLIVLAIGSAWFARQNHFEWMFRPAWDARFVPVADAGDLRTDEHVIGVSHGGEALAFPVRRIGYHHLVNTTVGGEPIVATYCTLCHTGLVWKRAAAGRTLTFRLIGINNQNMMMEDLETRSWWQQVSGEAVTGPLKGTRLERLVHDEVTLGLWKREHPDGRVLALIHEDQQIRRGWEARVATRPVVTEGRREEGLEPRSLVFGVRIDGSAKAYPRSALTRNTAIMDVVGTTPIAILVGADGHSARAFDRRIDGEPIELLARPDVSPARFVDDRTGSEWDIGGLAISGPLAGRALERISMHSDYWFDWSSYHPDTAVYRMFQADAPAAEEGE